MQAFLADRSLDDLFSGIDARGIIILAISGGSDSTALLFLASAWAQRHGKDLHAVTIDHGLRPEAAAEAAFVASICDSIAVDHTTLGWEGIKPGSGLQESARRARYNLLEAFAEEIGADAILTGHTSNDQAETVKMRLDRIDLTRGVIPARGLAGMARHVRLPGGIALHRPLLDLSRAELRAYLATLAQGWIEDPSNIDMAYERTRVRQKLAHDSVTAGRLLGMARTFGGFRGVIARDTAALLNATTRLTPGPIFNFDYPTARQAPRPVLLHAIQALLAAAGGGAHLASESSVADILDWIKAGQSRPIVRAKRKNLTRAIIEIAPNGFLRIFRENRGLLALSVEPGETVVWDGRIRFTNCSDQSLRVEPLTRQELAALECDRGARYPVVPRAALLATPLLRMPEGHFWLPMIENPLTAGSIASELTASAVAEYCSSADFPLLEWLETMEKQRHDSLLPGL